MAHGIIYMVDGDGLRRMTPSAPASEDRMQELVARYPELITDGDGDLLLVRREQPVGDGETDGRWSLDHLFVTRGGVPVLVELKRAVDTRLRREVVGQMLDYAANASAHWSAGTVAQSFAATAGGNADIQLSAFIGDRDAGDFWQQVDSNLQAGRIKLVFVADSIPRELALIVEFLNGQMKADVRAVELRWFAGEGGVETLSPRIIGETARTTAAKSPASPLPAMGLDEWIADRLAPRGADVAAGARHFITLIETEGGSVVVAARQGSLVSYFSLGNTKTLYPFSIGPIGMVRLSLGYLLNRTAFAEEAARAQLYAELEGIVGALHTRSLSGEPGFPLQLLLQPPIEQAFRGFLHRIVTAARSAEGFGTAAPGV